MDSETPFFFFLSLSKAKRDRDQNVVQSLRNKQNLQKILQRKAELADEAEAYMKVNHRDKKDSDMALHEVNQEFESQRFRLQQANRWADQAQRDKISLYGELELRNRFFQDSQAKYCKDTEEY